MLDLSQRIMSQFTCTFPIQIFTICFSMIYNERVEMAVWPLYNNEDILTGVTSFVFKRKC